MGQNINLNNREGALPDALTQTGQGGFLSGGYLADRPATAVLDDAETVQFVLTNRKRGVTIDGETVQPGSSYRTVAVLTDRRLVTLIGNRDGDAQFITPLVDIDRVETASTLRSGKVVVETGSETWTLYTATDGLDDVETYLRTASQAWIHVENVLETAEEKRRTAIEQRQAGEYDRALSTARSARQTVETARATALRFNSEYPGFTLRDRPECVDTQCVETIADIHVGRARRATDAGEQHWRERSYEAAYDAYERAREEYDAALALDHGNSELVERIQRERDRLDRIVTKLEQSPLRKAIVADNKAVAADDPETAADHWETALSHYRTVLEIDWGADERRFAGDPQLVRDRLSVVAEHLTSARRAVASDAMRAGDWYADAGQHAAAREEFEAALDAFEAAISTAQDCYPDAVDHLRTERDALKERLERTEARLDGTEDVADRIQVDDEPEYAVSGTLGSVEADEPAALERAAEPTVADGNGIEGLPQSTTDHLRTLDRPALVDVIDDALAETGCSTQPADAETPFDLLVRREGDLLGVIVHTPAETAVGTDTIRRCSEAVGAADTDGVMLATPGRLSKELATLAAESDVQVFAADSLSAIVDAQRISLPGANRRHLNG